MGVNKLGLGLFLVIESFQINLTENVPPLWFLFFSLKLCSLHRGPLFPLQTSGCLFRANLKIIRVAYKVIFVLLEIITTIYTKGQAAPLPT